ncbi:hypothetical protein LTR22_027669 [Elasticomyces elasticus]|nr:hypothetical protein LTR22_027669 [Elasticomyces elasticus]
MIQSNGYGSETAEQTTVAPVTISRKEPLGSELLIEVLYCGICHSDIELLANTWNTTKYPCVPGHEAVGPVIGKGPDVKHYDIGDIVGVGSVMDSCLECAACREGWENHCEGPNGPTITHGGYLNPSTKDAEKFNTFGAWAGNLVIKEEFVIRIPSGVDLARVAPLMCAGTDTFGPLTRFNLSYKSKLGILGFGGPGHVALQMAKKMGAGHVVVFTTHPEKAEAALRLGADHVVDSNDPAAMLKLSRSLSHILSTIPVPFDPTPYLRLLHRRGTMTVMALLGPCKKIFNNVDLAAAGLSLTGSMIGSITETRESLAFCLKHGILPEVEVIDPPVDSINKALDRLKAADVRFRFVIKFK